MRLIHLVPLFPLVLGAPAPTPDLPQLSLTQWQKVQGGFVDGLRTLGSWSWNKAEDALEELIADDSALTIWQQLQENDDFSKLVKIIKFEEKAIKYLDDKDSQITFFAPNNEALTPPHHKDHDDDDDELNELLATPSLANLAVALDRSSSLTSHKGGDNDDDDKKKRRREIFKKIAGKILQYHGLTKAYTGGELAQNSTVATALKAGDGSYGGLHRRIKITKTVIPPALKINFYAKVVNADQKARNGYLHTINHPLIPPGAILDELFLFPDTFSTFTSSIQKVHGAKYLDWHYDRNASSPGKPKFHGTPLTTVFVPNNVAFGLLPPKLKFYLFSPFGEHALTKILAYHFVPETLLLSELVYVDKGKKGLSDDIEAMTFFNLGDDPSFHKEFEIGTALPNATIKVVVDKTKVLPIEGAVKTTIKVNDELVEVIDVPARNGASHVIGKLLVPPHHHDHDGVDVSALDTFENWEQWLPRWADEQ